MNNEDNGDTSCTEIVDLNDKEEANKDVHDEEPMVGAKQNHDGGHRNLRPMRLKAFWMNGRGYMKKRLQTTLILHQTDDGLSGQGPS